jgi:hypothetical protein
MRQYMTLQLTLHDDYVLLLGLLPSKFDSSLHGLRPRVPQEERV